MRISFIKSLAVVALFAIPSLSLAAMATTSTATAITLPPKMTDAVADTPAGKEQLTAYDDLYIGIQALNDITTPQPGLNGISVGFPPLDLLNKDIQNYNLYISKAEALITNANRDASSNPSLSHSEMTDAGGDITIAKSMLSLATTIYNTVTADQKTALDRADGATNAANDAIHIASVDESAAAQANATSAEVTLAQEEQIAATDAQVSITDAQQLESLANAVQIPALPTPPK